MNLDEVIEKLESKRRDSVSFKKKYQTRKMDELVRYYEGAEWALTYCLGLLKDDTQ